MLSSSSSSSSSDEDEFEVFQIFTLSQIQKPPNVLLDAYNDVEFRKIYHFSKATVARIIEIFGPYLEQMSNRNQPMPVEKQILVTLRYLATGAEEHNDIQRSTISRIVKNTCSKICIAKKNFIKMPDKEKLIETQKKFLNIKRFPNVIGALNFTHINIQSPTAESKTYKNKNGTFSINVQIVADADLRILDITTHSGSLDENIIFETSQLKLDFTKGKYPNCFLLGSHNYNCTNYLLTPINYPKTSAEHKYNTSHNETWNVVEKTIELWKRRFSCLTSEMRVYIETIFDIIVATGVLHNIAIEMGDIEPFEEEEHPEENIESNKNTEVDNDNLSSRNFIINKIFSS